MSLSCEPLPGIAQLASLVFTVLDELPCHIFKIRLPIILLGSLMSGVLLTLLEDFVRLYFEWFLYYKTHTLTAFLHLSPHRW